MRVVVLIKHAARRELVTAHPLHDIGKQRLVVIHFHIGTFDIDDFEAIEQIVGSLQNIQLATLHVDFQ